MTTKLTIKTKIILLSHNKLHENYSAVMKGFIKFAKDDVEAEKWIATDKIYTMAGWENSERMNFRRNAFKNKSAS